MTFTKILDKFKKEMLVGYQPERTRWRRYKQKLNENNQYTMQCWEKKVVSTISGYKGFHLSSLK